MGLIELTIMVAVMCQNQINSDETTKAINYLTPLLKFEVNPDELGSSECPARLMRDKAEHFFLDTCPLEYDPLCQDPLFNKNHDFEFRCRFPLRTNSVLTMNSIGFMEMLRMRDPYARDWCMIVLFHSPSCPFSARLAPHFNEIPRKFKNILPVAVDASDFSKYWNRVEFETAADLKKAKNRTLRASLELELREIFELHFSKKSHRLNFRYGVSGTPTVLLWVNGMVVARMGKDDLNSAALKELITSHTDLTEIPVKEKEEQTENIIPKKLFEMGAELREVSIEMTESKIWNAIQVFVCILVCVITFIYHVRERILLCPSVLAWFQSKCGGPLCEDIYFLFYVVAPRYRAPPPPPPIAQEPAQDAPEVQEEEEEVENPEDVVPLPPLNIPAEEEQEVQL